MAKQRTVSQVFLQVFIPLSCVSVPFKAHGQVANCVASGSSSFHITFVRNGSVQGLWPSCELIASGSSSLHTTFMGIGSVQGSWPRGEPCRKWFFKWLLNLHKQQYKSIKKEGDHQKKKKKTTRYDTFTIEVKLAREARLSQFHLYYQNLKSSQTQILQKTSSKWSKPHDSLSIKKIPFFLKKNSLDKKKEAKFFTPYPSYSIHPKKEERT